MIFTALSTWILFLTPSYANPPVDKLTFLLYKAPNEVNWESPGHLFRSVFWNIATAQSNPMSHINVSVQCSNAKSLTSGMTRVFDLRVIRSVFLGNGGLDLLTQQYPGRLLSQKEIFDHLPQALEQNRIQALSFHIHPSTCQRLISYYSEYKSRNYGQIYSGFKQNPFKGEGAGCSAFALSFLKVAGLFEKSFSLAWSRRLNVEEALIHSKPRTGFWGYLMGYNEAWASSSQNSEELVIYDPELIYHWVITQRQNKNLDFKISNWHQIPELILDRSKSPTPKTDYWSYSWP